MSEHVLVLRSMDLKGCLDFLGGLSPVPDATHYTLDLGELGHVSPFGMLMCSLGLRRFRGSLPDCSFDVHHWEQQGYAGHMGFFKAFGADYGKAPGEAEGSDRYLPITILLWVAKSSSQCRNGLTEGSGDACRRAADGIIATGDERKTGQIAGVETFTR